MHDLRELRVSVSGGDSACADYCGAAAGATNTGVWEDTYGTKLFLALEKNGNALGLSAMERDKFIQSRVCRSLMGRRSTVCGWGAWVGTIRRGARLLRTLRG